MRGLEAISKAQLDHRIELEELQFIVYGSLLAYYVGLDRWIGGYVQACWAGGIGRFAREPGETQSGLRRSRKSRPRIEGDAPTPAAARNQVPESKQKHGRRLSERDGERAGKRVGRTAFVSDVIQREGGAGRRCRGPGDLHTVVNQQTRAQMNAVEEKPIEGQLRRFRPESRPIGDPVLAEVVGDAQSAESEANIRRVDYANRNVGADAQ